jgi:hypothetical protein
LDHAFTVVLNVKPWETGPPSLSGVGIGFDDGDVEIVWARG